jgi:response regulator RpfG family c-di-GMP phosphodiesterase
MSIFKKENLRSVEPTPAAERRTVMVVDDKDANISVMAAILRPHFHIIEARDGQEALKMIEDMPEPETLACIVSDHRMPKMTGVQLFEKVAELLPQTRRVLVTGYVDLDAVVDSINRAAIYKFISKPFDAPDFLLTIKCAVTAYEQAQLMADYYKELDKVELSPQASVLFTRAKQAGQELAALSAELRALRVQNGG